jgi:hypothetical protein
LVVENDFKFTPHPGKQTEILASTADYLFAGGARGGTKTFSLAWKAAFQPRKWHYEHKGQKISRTDWRKLQKINDPDAEIIIDKVSIDYPEYRGLIVRLTFPQLETNVKPECDKLYTEYYGGKWKERDHCYVFPSGARIYLKHCQDQRALNNFIGGNYHFVGVDEANMFPEEWVKIIFSSARTTNKELGVMRVLTGNPGGKGHVWLKKLYVDRCKPLNDGPPVYNKEFDITYQPKKTGKPYFEDGLKYVFIPSLVFDNPSIIENDPAYVKDLKTLNPTLRKMWLEGDWNTFSGQYFDMWDYNLHVIEKKSFVLGRDFTKQTHRLYRFYDYGTHAPFVCLFAAVDADGKMIIFDEIVETGLGPSRQAQLVNKYSYDKYKLGPDDFYEEIADPKSYWTKSQERDAGDLWSPSDFYELEGIDLIPGNNDRRAGALVTYQGFTIPEDGIPGIRFTSNCRYSIDTIPNLSSKRNDPEDVDTTEEDHSYDALRYGAVRILDTIKPQKEVKKGWRDKVLGSKLASRSMSITEYWESQEKSMVKVRKTWHRS